MQPKYTAKYIVRFWGKVQKGNSNDCWIWTAAHLPLGYGRVRYNYKLLPSHRVAYEITYGEIPDGMVVCHKCDNPPCVNPSHLFLGTQKDNIHDMMRKGRQNIVLPPRKHGEEHQSSKLTNSQVIEIRQRFARYGRGGDSARMLAIEFGVSEALISLIANGKLRA